MAGAAGSWASRPAGPASLGGLVRFGGWDDTIGVRAAGGQAWMSLRPPPCLAVGPKRRTQALVPGSLGRCGRRGLERSVAVAGRCWSGPLRHMPGAHAQALPPRPPRPRPQARGRHLLTRVWPRPGVRGTVLGGLLTPCSPSARLLAVPKRREGEEAAAAAHCVQHRTAAGPGEIL